MREKTTPQSVVVIIGGDIATIDRAVALGLNVFLIQQPKYFDAAALRNVVGCLILDYETCETLEAHVRALQARYSVVSVVSLTEFGLLPTARLTSALGLPGVSLRAAEQTRDKVRMREVVAHVQKLASQPVDGATSAQIFGNKVSYPIIIKPLDGYGSKSVTRIDREMELSSVDWGNGPYIAEKFITGRLVSVEAFSFAGKHFIYGVNEEFPVGESGPLGCNPYVEVAHQLPAMVNDAELAALHALLPRVLDALDLRDGPSHTEFILSDSGPVLIECHTRVGGDFIPEMIQRCTGVDLLTLSVAWPAGRGHITQPAAQWRRGAAMRFFTPPPGRVTKISGLEACEDMPGVAMLRLRVKPGDTVGPLQYAADRVGFVMAVCDTSAEAMQVCDAVLERVRIEIEPAKLSA